MRKTIILKVFMAIVTCLFCMQTALAADTWSYPTENPGGKPDGKYGGGDGTAGSPYLISTAQQLVDFAYMVNNGASYKGKYFKMTADVTLNDIQFGSDNQPTNLRSLRAWTSIGRASFFWPKKFEGIFDGDNHTVSGLYIYTRGDRYEYGHNGLFDYLSEAIVRNLNIKNSYIYCEGKYDGNTRAGFLASHMANSQIINCHVSDSHIFAVENSYNNLILAGGIVCSGMGKSESMTSCSFDGTILLKVTSSGTYKIAGLMAEGAPTLNDCRVSGTIEVIHNSNYSESKNITVAGLCYEAKDMTGCTSDVDFKLSNNSDRPYFEDASLNLYTLCQTANNISKSVSLARIYDSSTKHFYANLGNVGKAQSIRDCAFYTTVNGSFSAQDTDEKKFTYYPLGSSGKNDIGEVKRVVLLNAADEYFHTPDSKCLSRADVNKGSDYSDFYESTVEFMSMHEDFLKTLNSGDKQTTVWGYVIDDNSAFNGCPLPVECGGQFEKNMLQGEGTEESPYLIGSEEELRYLAKIAKGSVKGQYFALTADIDMSGSEPLEAIGNTNSFSGIFNGNGHVISNVELGQGGLFGTVTGKVENLAVVNAEISDETDTESNIYYYGVIARQLADGGTIQSCYVGGDITLNGSLTKGLPYIGSICGGIGTDYPSVTGVYDCYFKGRVNISAEPHWTRFGGLVGTTTLLNVEKKPYLKISDSYASFTVLGLTDDMIFGVCNVGDPYVTVDRCYYVCPQKPDSSITDGFIACKADSEIFAGQEFTDADPWIRGVYRPMLKTTRLYKVTAADGSDNEMYIDAIPMTDSSNPSNDILHYTAKDGDESNKVLWALPNLAIYTGADKSEYILNCTLDPAKPFGYNLKKSCPAEAVYVNMHYPLAVSNGHNFEMLCLPGTVTRDCLPEGCALLVGGKGVVGSDSKTTMYMAAVDSVPAGVPFMVYLSDDVVKANTTLDIVMRSRMAIEPLKSITTDDGKTQEFDLTGTFSGVVAKNACNTDVDGSFWDSNADLLQLIPQKSCTARPFTSYIDGQEGTVKFTRSLYLSDKSDRTGDLLESCDGKNLNVCLSRSLKTDSWNTICLPFSMTAAEVESTFGEGTLLEELGSVTTDADGGCSLQFTSATNGIEAGKSYLIKPTKSSSSMYNLAARAISNKLADTEESVVIGGDNATVAFCGTFERKLLGDSDADEYFTQANTIYHVADGQYVVMNGFRAYITASKAAAAAMAKARIVHSNGSTTNLHLVEVGSSTDGQQRVYDLQGVEQNTGAQQRGVYIKGGRKYVK